MSSLHCSHLHVASFALVQFLHCKDRHRPGPEVAEVEAISHQQEDNRARGGLFCYVLQPERLGVSHLCCCHLLVFL